MRLMKYNPIAEYVPGKKLTMADSFQTAIVCNNNNNKLYLYSTFHDMKCSAKCFTEQKNKNMKTFKTI